MQRLPVPSRSFLYSMATAPSRWWPPALARRGDPLLESWNPHVRHLPRFYHGSRHMANGTGVKGDEFKPEQSSVHTSHDRMITVGERFAITQGMSDEKNKGAVEEFIAPCGLVHPGNSEDGGRVSVNILSGVEDADRAAVGAKNGKREAQIATMDDASTTTGPALCSDGNDDAGEGNEFGDEEDDTGEGNGFGDGEEYTSSGVEEDVCCYEDDSDYVYPLDALEDSSHRDGSVYNGTQGWQRDYCLTDVSERFLY